MKNNNFIFTRARMGMDSRVWLTMFITLLIAAGILSFKAATYEECSLDEITTASVRQQKDHIFYIGENVSFSVDDSSGKKLLWNFDDGTTLKGEKTIQHRFFKKGDFNVVCIVEGSKCQQNVLVNIIPAPPVVKEAPIFYGKPIDGPDTAYVGIAANYNTQIKGSYFQWSASGLPDVKTSQQVSFVFYKPGPQILTLKVDGTKSYTKPLTILAGKTSAGSGGGNANVGGGGPSISLIPYINAISPASGGPGTKVTINGSFFNGTKSVSFGGIEAASFQLISPTQLSATVAEGSQTGPVVVTTGSGATPAPTPQFTYIPPKVAAPPTTNNNATATAPVHPGISDPNLMTLLKKVAVGDPNVTIQKLAEFFCNGEGTLVKIPSDKKAITLAELYKRLQATKDVNVTSAKIIRDPNNPDCEINLLVSYTEPKKLFGIKVGKKQN